MDISFEIELFVSIVVFGTVPYFVFVYVPVPVYEHKHPQQTSSKNIKKCLNMYVIWYHHAKKHLFRKKWRKKLVIFIKITISGSKTTIFYLLGTYNERSFIL